MERGKVYWFDIPYLPGMQNIAVSPYIRKDGRLCFMVPGNFGPPWSGVWCLTGEVIQNQKEEFEFRCDDSVMGNRGGTYHFKLLTMEKYREHRRGWYEDHEEVLKCYQGTGALQKWFLKHWPNPAETEEMQAPMNDVIKWGIALIAVFLLILFLKQRTRRFVSAGSFTMERVIFRISNCSEARKEGKSYGAYTLITLRIGYEHNK